MSLNVQGDGRSVLLTASRWPLFMLVLIGLFAAGQTVQSAGSPDPVNAALAWFTGPLAVAALGAALLAKARMRSTDWLLCLDVEGVTVRGHPMVPWSAFQEVRWIASRGRFGQAVLVFVPQAGTALPGAPALLLARVAAAGNTRRHGSPWALQEGHVATPLAAVVTAIQQLTDVPLIAD